MRKRYLSPRTVFTK